MFVYNYVPKISHRLKAAVDQAHNVLLRSAHPLLNTQHPLTRPFSSLHAQALVGLFRLSTLPLRRWPRYLAFTVLPPVAAVVGASFYLDSRLYGVPTLVPLNFLRFNVLEGNSRIFGEQAWHWNFSQGLPAVLGAALPASLWGFARPFGEEGRGPGSRRRRRLGWLAVWFLGEGRRGMFLFSGTRGFEG